MRRGRKHLNRRRRRKLHDRLPTDDATRLVAHVAPDGGAKQDGHVEARKDGDAVARRKEGVARGGDATHGLADGAKHARVDLVFVDAHADVGGGGGGEFGGARGDVRGGLVGKSGGEGVDGVGGQVGCAVGDEDEGDGFGEEHGVGLEEEGAERGFDGGAERGAARGVFHYGAGRRRRVC